MGLDIRLPIGMMFSILGALMSIYGIATNGDATLYQASLGVNVNFWWGLALFFFGAVMLIFAVRHRFRQPTQSP